MFCVLNVEKKSLTLLEKIFKFLARDEYRIRTVPVFKGAPFYLLDVFLCNNTIDWEKITTCTGKCAKRLLVNNCIDTPPNKEIGFFKSNILYNKAFQNTLIQILNNNKLNIKPQHIAVCDKKGIYTDFASRLIPYASKLTVVTENKEKYMDLCDHILESTGLCISVLSDFDNAKIKIDTERNLMSVDLKTEFVNVCNGEELMVNDMYKKLLPQGIDECDFYSALYELCGVFSLGECIFEKISVNNEKKRTDTVTFS